MKTASVTEAKAQLSRLLELVRRGETVVILHRGSPVARLSPVRDAGQGAAAEQLVRLVRAGVVQRGAKPPDARVLGRPGKKLPREKGLLEALLKDREEGR